MAAFADIREPVSANATMAQAGGRARGHGLAPGATSGDRGTHR